MNRVTEGRPWPMGASLTETGVNFAVFSAHAEGLELCLFSEDGAHETERLPFAAREGDIWHLHVAGLGEGTVYGLRAHGPWDPVQGHRFNPMKLLLDPYARALRGAFAWDDAVPGHEAGHPEGDLRPDSRDSAAFMPKALVVRDGFDWQGDRPPERPLHETVIYEAHLRGLTMLHPEVAPEARGLCAGLASDPVIAHLKRLGVTAVELLPVQAILDERFLVTRGLRNYWGYNTLGFFVPEPRYTGPGGMAEFQRMVRRLHREGIEVILDMVFNHSAEGDEFGPTLSFRGLDNASYYRLTGGGRHYANDAGTGNTLDLSHPMVLRLVMDALRYWVGVAHVDGFRFDLATVLGRGQGGFDPGAAFFHAIRQDPVLARVKLIAEPWDPGPGGYRLGQFPHPFLEWNDRFRDSARRFWRGDSGAAGDLAAGLLGSAGVFDHSGRPATSSVNYIASHDGFTLADLTSYRRRHNGANGEGNRDGHRGNHSDNMGVEGPSGDPAICAARGLRRRNLLATLFLAQGVPMLLAGDESGHSQGGNNNAYAQDNATTWLDWSRTDAGLAAFTARLIALRQSLPVLRQRRFLHGGVRADGLPDVIWRRPDGAAMQAQDWQGACFCLELRMAPGSGEARPVFIAINRGPDVGLTLPDTVPRWDLVLDTTRPLLTAEDAPAIAPADSVLLLVAGGKTTGETG